MEEKITFQPHSLIIEDRKKVSITGVSDVGSFDEENLMVFTQYGEINIHGEELQVSLLSTESGEVVAEGRIISVNYSDRVQKNGGFFSKVFK